MIRYNYYRKLLREQKIFSMLKRGMFQEQKENTFKKYIFPVIMALIAIMLSALILDIKDDISDTKLEIKDDLRAYENRLTKVEENLKTGVIRLEKLEKKSELFEKRLKELESIFGYKITFLRRLPCFIYPVIYRDHKDRILVDLTIDILSEQFRWKCNELTVLLGSKPSDLGEVIEDYTIDRDLYNAKKIICIGTASTEGDIETQEELAENRAQLLINKVKKYIADPKIPILGMNFGKYMGNGKNIPCSKRTINQRRIVIIKIIRQNVPDDQLEESLKRVLEEKAQSTRFVFPIDIRKYSKYKSNMLIYGRNLERKCP